LKREPNGQGRTWADHASAGGALRVLLAAVTIACTGMASPIDAGAAPLASPSRTRSAPAAAAGSPARALALAARGGYRPGVVLVGFRSSVPADTRYQIERSAGAGGARRLGPAVAPTSPATAATGGSPNLSPFMLQVAPGEELAVVHRLRASRAVAYAEPDYLMVASAAPNDPFFTMQWGDSNVGQLIPTQESEEKLGPEAKGTAGADDRALEAWGVTTGNRSIVIGETDTGVDYTHPDLAANIWSNPGGVGGCAAGTHGFNVLAHSCDPMDDDKVYGGHGTHVAGIMGAVGNNGIGVAGMNWQTTILPVKWLSSSAWGETSGLIEALQSVVAAKQAGVNVRVVNDSATFKGTAYSQALSDEIDTLGANNILFVTAAGNTGDNNDEEKVRRYPCGYDRPSEICVTATDNNDKLPSWANYGPHTVDLAAPGVSIYSTLREGKYRYLSGGSMAAAQVSGAAALILSAQPTMTAGELKSAIVGDIDPLPSLTGRVISGGRLDVCKAVLGCSGTSGPPQTATFGKTSIGASTDVYTANRKRVSAYALPSAGAVTKLSTYLTPTATSGQQVLEGVIYTDNGGVPAALAGVSQQLSFASTNSPGWYDLVFSKPVKLAAGRYWIGLITGATGKVAGFRYDSVSGSRDYNTNSYSSGPSSPFGSVTTDGEQASLYATYRPAPVNTGPPGIAGAAQQGQTLTAVRGSWTGEPSAYAYQWTRCDTAGAGCAPINGATGQTYTLAAADVGHTLRVQETATNEAGTSSPASSSATAVVSPTSQTTPVSTSPPAIAGTAQQGQTLALQPGTWSNSPTAFAYQWMQCDAIGQGCLPIAGATGSTYVLVAADVGHTIVVQETASNAAGSSSPASSSATSTVQAASGQFGKSTMGTSSDTFLADRKRVNRYALTVAGRVSKLSIYLAHTATSGQQVLKGLIYADSGGAPEALLGVSEQLTFTSTSPSGWYDLSFSSPISLSAGNYWIGVITGPTSGVAAFRYDSVTGSRAYNANTYSAGPSNPFGGVTSDSEQTSLYATYSPN
jgi:subtilisin family serine protease